MRRDSQAYSQEHALLAHRRSSRARLGAVAALLLLLVGCSNVVYLRHSLHEHNSEAAHRVRQELEINNAALDSDISVESSSASAHDQQLLDATDRKPLFPEPLVPPLSGRGIVLPLYDEIAATGISLVLELRAMDVDLPIEVPHCGDLQPKYQQLLANRDQLVRIYDVCALALQDRNEEDDPRFCATLVQCHERFRGFDIKVLAVVFSRFQELMLMDADTLFFQSPMRLWAADKYKTTGTLFFHDRICSEKYFLADLHPGSYPFISRHQFFLSKFDLTDFESLANIPRSNEHSGPAERVRDDPEMIIFPFEPSDFLVTSHSWNRRAGHEMDSSLLLWDKERQPRATAILASFIALNGPGRPPGFGDKELYFSACELAETAYAFTDFGVGSIGWDQRTIRDQKTHHNTTVLCGDMVQYFPELSGVSNRESSLLYLSSHSAIAKWHPDTQRMYRTLERPAAFYAGSFDEHGIPQECPFNATILPLTSLETNRILLRQQLHGMVLEWLAPGNASSFGSATTL